jgi:hypothetical protein
VIHVNGVNYVTADEGAEWLGADINPPMIRQWGSRHMVNRYRVAGRTYYSIEELIEVEYVTRTSRAGRRRSVVP